MYIYGNPTDSLVGHSVLVQHNEIYNVTPVYTCSAKEEQGRVSIRH